MNAGSKQPQGGSDDHRLHYRHVWFVNHYAGLPSQGSTGRHFEFAKNLPNHGWTATIITARRSASMPARDSASDDGVEVIYAGIPSRSKIPAARVVVWVAFAASVLRPSVTRRSPSPDVVVGSTVHPLAAWAGWRLARRHRVPFVFEVRDVWPETLVDLGAVRAGGAVDRAMSCFMRYLVSKSELVLSPLPFISKWLEEMGTPEKPTAWISNGTEVSHLDASQRDRMEGEPFTFMYLGAHGNANALSPLLAGFEHATSRRPDLNLRLRMIGEGPLKPALRAEAEAMECRNRITFEDSVPASGVPALEREADCLVATVADLDVYRYGISMNKIFTYLVSGRPTIIASSAPNDPIANAGAGFSVEADTADALGDALIKMAESSPDEREMMARAGQEHAEEQYSYATLTGKLSSTLDAVVDTWEARVH